MKRKQIDTFLATAQANGTLIRLKRSFDTWNTYGYIVGLSQKWVLVHTVEDCHFDGWIAFRIADITQSVEDSPTFVDRLLSKRGQLPQPVPALDITSISSLLNTAHLVAPLVQIELEKLWPDTCYIGQVGRVGKNKVRLAEVSPQATWEKTSGSYPLRKITKICLRNEYCEGLWEMLSEQND